MIEDTTTTKQKFLVCVSASPSSAKIIEWTAKTAKVFNAQWVALYIETPDALRLGNSANELLKKNIALAKSLGGEFVQIEGYQIAQSVVEYAKQADITNIVIGKSRNKRTLKTYFEKSVEDKIIALLDNIEVHIIPDTAEKRSFQEPKKRNEFSPYDILKSLIFLLLATGVCFLLQAFKLDEVNFILVYGLTVILTSIFTQSYLYGVFSAIAGVLLVEFLFVEPYYGFHPIDTEYLFRLLTMLTVSIIMGTVTAKMKNRSARAIRREKYLENLHALSQKIIKVRGLDNIIKTLVEYFAESLKLNACIHSQESENTIVAQVFSNGQTAGKFTKNHSELQSYYVPLHSNDKVFFVVEIDCMNVSDLDEEERTFIKMALAQFALAIEKQMLSDSQKQVLVSMEKEKTRSNLLRSVSHDLRTPLTAIFGSATTIANEDLDKATTKTLADSICEDSGWLIRMVENLLLVTKISGDGVSLKKQAEAAEEIIAEAVARVKARFEGCNIKTSIPDELLLVPMDGMLIEQVLINLLDNSVKYSGDKTVEISLCRQDDNAVIKVSDNGKGITEKEILAIEKGETEGAEKISDGKKGMGIGLSLCHTIIKAHAGSISAQNKASGGAEFTITLPMEENANE